MQEDCLVIAETDMPVNTIEQSWVFEIGEMTRASRTSTKLVSTLVRILAWVNHLGSGKIDESRLESRHGIHHDLRARSIGL